MPKTKSKVDAFIKSEKVWPNEAKLMREVCLECDLQEDFKWRFPCYTRNGKNLIMIQTFKNMCALMFFNGVLLKDPKKILKSPGDNSQIVKRLEFHSLSDVKKVRADMKALIKQAIKVNDSGAKVVKSAPKKLTMPEELQAALNKNKKLKIAFEKLTPGRQRLYTMHIASAKQEATRIARVEKCVPKILKGLGLHD
ncbi:YdeI/OmpD-associated family protein [Bdellovibrio sp. SKB1291214]|uniref:YdeI/OmpD-associated family protein n=1 Tax=Bdellovibrio sp. SKB1291214 TaxID=1732569 RepID=UPI000B519FEA|nr:YdeI/OmpD-associated family protein [Bdellovibrio sp. SKB1291214]UYL07239.1 YdeI/OmpD-associated family protein [Bdellovibrio sp. SKB1291214]